MIAAVYAQLEMFTVRGDDTMKGHMKVQPLTAQPSEVTLDRSVSVSASESSRVQGESGANIGGAEGPTFTEQLKEASDA